MTLPRRVQLRYSTLSHGTTFVYIHAHHVTPNTINKATCAHFAPSHYLRLLHRLRSTVHWYLLSNTQYMLTHSGQAQYREYINRWGGFRVTTKSLIHINHHSTIQAAFYNTHTALHNNTPASKAMPQVAEANKATCSNLQY